MNCSALRARTFFLQCRLSKSSCTVSTKYASQKLFSTTPRLRSTEAPVTSREARKPFYVTTPIFYVNAEPHVGHLYTDILADVLKRWQVLKGNHDAVLLTGTDEHGMKVQKAAEVANMTPQAMCDQNARAFKELADAANISYDRFIRTTDQDHKDAVEHFWTELRQRDYIYESKHEGWYSVSDETFYPESQVHLVLDPATGRKMHASMETGKEVEWTSETNYRFRLSAFRDRLLQHYKDNPTFIVPEPRMNFIKKEVEAGLQDLSVSRPSSRLQWGIPVPDDDSQTIYVWLDALINYITMAGYPFQGSTQMKDLWPPDVQIIGKDIVRFHTIYWPAFLMALDLPLPKAFLTHAHWTMNNAKMSKSLGNGVNPFLAFERYGLDTIRFFMIHNGGIADDADYDNEYIVAAYKKGLQGGLGNLVARVCRPRTWNVKETVATAAGNGLPEKPDWATVQFIKLIDDTAVTANAQMESLDPRAAIQTIMTLVAEANKYFHSMEPWDQSLARNQVQETIFATAESIRVSCILLQPFMPDKMKQALDELLVDSGKRSFQYAKYGVDYSYGAEPKRPGKKLQHNSLFPPLASEY